MAAGDRQRAGPGSTLPPERIATVVPARPGATWPPSSAATPTAPAPSTTSLQRSSSTTIASATSSSSTTAIAVEPLAEQRQREVARALDGDPVGDRQRRLGRHRRRPPRSDAGNGAQAATCTPTTSTSGRADLTAIAMPAASPPPPTGTTTLREIGHVLEQLEPERALPRDDVRVVERVDERQPAPRARARARRRGTRPARRRRRARSRPGRAPPRPWRSARRRGRRPRTARRARPRRRRAPCAWLPAEAATTPRGARLPQRGELGRGAAHLERAGALEVLGLQHDRAAGALGDRARREHRRAPGDALDLRRAARRDRRAAVDGLSPGAARIASISTSAPSGSEATPIVLRAGGASPK